MKDIYLSETQIDIMYKYALKEKLIESRQIELKEKLPAFYNLFFFCYPHRENCGLREVINRKTG